MVRVHRGPGPGDGTRPGAAACQDRERMARLRSAADRDEFALSHAVLARCLGALTGVAPTALRFAVRGEGKPELLGQGPAPGRPSASRTPRG
ncbi:hypothetical protein ACR6C2_30095 [Streptomyces sp. INA 01156]